MGLNRYTYVLGNPLKFVDPDGLLPATMPVHIGQAIDIEPIEVAGSLAAGVLTGIGNGLYVMAVASFGTNGYHDPDASETVERAIWRAEPGAWSVATGSSPEADAMFRQGTELGRIFAPVVGTVAGKPRSGGGSIPPVRGLLRIRDIRAALGVGKRRNIAYAELSVTGLEENKRMEDSEVRILESIASRISPDAKGRVRLFSERKSCESCGGVLDQFEAVFPKVKLEVTWGTK